MSEKRTSSFSPAASYEFLAKLIRSKLPVEGLAAARTTRIKTKRDRQLIETGAGSRRAAHAYFWCLEPAAHALSSMGRSLLLLLLLSFSNAFLPFSLCFPSCLEE